MSKFSVRTVPSGFRFQLKAANGEALLTSEVYTTEAACRKGIDSVIKNAATILLMYLSLFFFGGLAISIIEGAPMLDCLFETASAVGTVGLTLGITPGLGMISRVILIVLMFFGRVGGLTLIFAALTGAKKNVSRLPKERITVG